MPGLGKMILMKALLPRVLLLASLTFATMPMRAEAKPPAAYPLKAHISASTYAPNPLSQIITVTIGSQHLQMIGPTSSRKVYSGEGDGLLNPGDYPARLTKDTHRGSYQSIQEFEIQMPDGTSRKFDVIGQSEQAY